MKIKAVTFLYVMAISIFNGKVSNAAMIIESKTWNDSSYYLISPDTWNNVEAFANTLGGHLVTINSQEEQDFLWQTWGLSGTSVHNYGEIWIGLNDRLVEGSFQWANGEALNFSQWALGEPNNSGNEDYAHMWHSAGGSWNDEWGGRNFVGIAEISQVSAPSTLALMLSLVSLAFYRKISKK